jgi:hypothetical protein
MTSALRAASRHMAWLPMLPAPITAIRFGELIALLVFRVPHVRVIGNIGHPTAYGRISARLSTLPDAFRLPVPASYDDLTAFRGSRHAPDRTATVSRCSMTMRQRNGESWKIV